MPHGPSDIVAEDVERLLERTAAVWEGLRGARVFVTGGTGFIGSWILEALSAADTARGLGLAITVLSRDPSGFVTRHPRLAASSAVRLVAGDVRDFVPPAGTFTHVIHAATESATRLDRDDPGTMLEVCREGTRRVVDFSVRRGAARVLFVSSGAVYARSGVGDVRFVEGMPTAAGPGEPSGAYAEGKRAAESICLDAAAAGAGVTIARVFALVGPGLPLDAHFAVGNFIRDAVAGGPIVVRGDGTSVRSYLYAADLVEWLVTILLRGSPGRAYNVGGEEGVSMSALAARVAAVARTLLPGGDAPRIVTLGEAVAGTAPQRYLPDCSRARADLGLRPTTSLDEGIRRTMVAAVRARSMDGPPRPGVVPGVLEPTDPPSP